jgi:hypothetical protein
VGRRNGGDDQLHLSWAQYSPACMNWLMGMHLSHPAGMVSFRLLWENVINYFK